MRRTSLICLLLAPALLGCAPQPKTRASQDLASCRRMAEEQMGPGAAIAPDTERTGNPMDFVRHEEIRSQYRTMVDECMGRELEIKDRDEKNP